MEDQEVVLNLFIDNILILRNGELLFLIKEVVEKVCLMQNLRENTTWDLVSDIEMIREYLKIDSWVVFGGSWGSTLSFIYAIKNPKRCKGLILRGIFMLRKIEIDWFYQEGCNIYIP